MDAQRALLDSLLGNDRNAKEDGKKQSFKDDNICKHWLVGMCPHECFVNQEGKAAVNSPIGACKKQHSEAMKRRLESDKEYGKYRKRYLEDVLLEFKRLIEDNERKSKREKARVKDGGSSCTKEAADAVDGHILAREMIVNEKLQAAERMAEEGMMDASKDTMKEAQELAHQKYRLTRLKEVAEAWVDDFCDVCGCQISWRSVEEIEARNKGRAHPHTMGAWHLGWAKVRQQLAEIQKLLAAATSAERLSLEDEGKDGKKESRSRAREKERDSRKKDRSRSRNREKEKDARKGDRSRSRDREKEKDVRKMDRSRSGDREKEKDDRKPDGSRSRDREKEKEAKKKGKEQICRPR